MTEDPLPNNEAQASTWAVHATSDRAWLAAALNLIGVVEGWPARTVVGYSK
jgi:hypothetical protein